jgi:septal ring factor EnvC (AmiA/AmiB activator)
MGVIKGMSVAKETKKRPLSDSHQQKMQDEIGRLNNDLMLKDKRIQSMEFSMEDRKKEVEELRKKFRKSELEKYKLHHIIVESGQQGDAPPDDEIATEFR